MPDASTITAARTLLQAWREELHRGHVNVSTGQVDDVDTARDIAEIDQVVASLADIDEQLRAFTIEHGRLQAECRSLLARAEKAEVAKS